MVKKSVNNIGLDLHIILPNKTFEPTKYELLNDFIYEDIVVPKGFTTDGASVPRMFWGVFPPTGRYFIAALIHDYLLESKEYIPENWDYANKKFKEVLISYNVDDKVVFLLYNAVKLHFFKKKLLYKYTKRV